MTCTHSVGIDGTDYRVTSLCGGGWQLNREAKVYDITLADGRIACTCPDYAHRQSKTLAARCKHGAALAQLGLITPHAQVTQDTAIGLDQSVPEDRPAGRE
jgi:hypothetical protein